MDCETKLWLVVLFFFGATYVQQCVIGEPQVPCVFIFGDSLADNGNNNKLSTDSKVNYLPYGIDFPAGPTGRFTNGRTAVDIITQLLGLDDFIPPYANLSGSDLLKGVNYASGGAGIRTETGTSYGEDINMDLQLKNHKNIVSQIAKKLGSADEAQKHLNKCLYYSNIGSNDYLNNYFLPEQYPGSQKYSLKQYAKVLVQQYSMQLKVLHALGARKFAVVGVGPLGCVPHEIKVHGKNGSLALCVDEENKAADIFNNNLKALVNRFNEELSDSKFIFINTGKITLDKLQLPDIVLCCKVGPNGLCIRDQEPCQHRNLRVYFDAFHPTEIGNQILARSAYSDLSPIYTHPMNISELVKL